LALASSFLPAAGQAANEKLQASLQGQAAGTELVSWSLKLMEMKKGPLGCLGYVIGDEILPSYIGIIS